MFSERASSVSYTHLDVYKRQGRERLTVTGVEDVERFDELSVVMRTAAGVLVVTGEDLHLSLIHI